METTNIYILIDPENQQVRYVGKANNVSERYKAHLNRARKHQIHKLNWINSLRKKGLKPIIEVIDVVPINDWVFWETYWIAQFKAWGFKLINYTNGGDGATFGNQTSFKKGNTAHNDTNTIIQCQNCNKDFKINPSLLGKKKFCCMKCYAESKKGKPLINGGTFETGVIPWNKGLKYKTKKE
mgnify:CR=1 FL=1